MHSVVVLSSERGKGIGKFLVENFINYIREKLNPKKFLLICYPNIGTFYEKLGFEKVQEFNVAPGEIMWSMEYRLTFG